MGRSCCGFKRDSSSGQLIPEHKLIRDAAMMGRNLTEPEAYQVIEDYGIPIPRFGVARSPEEARRLSVSIGYPVVMKIVSPDILHKSDIGGVKLGLANEEAVREAYEDIMSSVLRKQPDAKIDGILIARAANKPVDCKGEVGCSDVLEVIIGAVRDPEFGYAVMFGLGGIFVEIARDVVFRVTPVTREDALGMMSEIKASNMLDGVRGRAPRDKDALADIIVAVSRLVQENPSISAVDLNPVLSFAKGACVVDAKIAC
jgi:acyl-CoA synthetase (NDP forming)